MNLCRCLLIVYFLFSFLGTLGQEIKIYQSNYSVQETLNRLDSIIRLKGYQKMYQIDHLELNAEALKDFEDSIYAYAFNVPEISAGLMNCDRTASHAIPFQLLVWQENSKTHMSYVEPRFTKRRFRLIDCDDMIDRLNRILIRVTNEVIRVSE